MLVAADILGHPAGAGGGGGGGAPPPRQQLTKILFLHKHRADDDQAFHDELDVGVDVLKLKDVGKQAEDQNADKRFRRARRARPSGSSRR